MRIRKLGVALAVGLFSGYLAYSFCSSYNKQGGDFGYAYWQAHQMLRGLSPYPPSFQILYPVPAALLAIPFTIFPADVAGGVFFGLSCAILCYLTTPLIFTCLPFVWALTLCQWPPLMMASVFLPGMGAILLKPQLGIPCAVRSRSWWALWSPVLIGLFSLILYPTWPLDFLHQAKGFPHFSPLFYSIGPIMLLSLFWWRDKDVQFLLLMALVPQRFLYDAFPLWLIPKSKKEIAFLSGCSWLGFAYWWNTLPHTDYPMVWQWSVVFHYIPAFLMISWRKSVNLRRAAFGIRWSRRTEYSHNPATSSGE